MNHLKGDIHILTILLRIIYNLLLKRPGLAPIASAAAVELMVGLLHHPEGHAAPADALVPPMAPFKAPGQPLGALPHQLRGFLATFGVVHPLAHAFEHCTACNARVVRAYRDRGFELVRSTCRSADHLADVSGLAAFQRECEELASGADFDLSDDGSGDDF